MKNLIWVLVSFISLLSSTLSAAIQPVPSTLLASNFENKSSATLVADGSMLLATNLTISNRFSFQAGSTYQFNITAYGTPASGAYPTMRLGIDGYTLKDISISSGTSKVYTYSKKLEVGGDRNLQFSFTNDASTSTENRDLYIKSVEVKLVDATAPTVTISSGPTSTTTSQTPTFTFTASDASGISSTQCSLDNASFSSCSSPKSYSSLSVGSHTFKVKAVDNAGNQTISSIYTWSVVADTTGPVIYPPSEGSDSPYALEILQPQAGLDTKNRFYKAYPGLPYSVRLAVTGGSYPYKFSLKTAPSGMTINTNTGEITWPNPIVQSTAYPTTVEVIDNRGAVKQVSWTILVTTDKFMFVDPVNGKNKAAGGTGQINNPFKDFTDVYGGTSYASKYANPNQDYFVYFKGGAPYVLNGYTAGKSFVQWTNRQPLVWLAYPGHSPVIDMEKVALRIVDAHDDVVNGVSVSTFADNFYFEGFEIMRVNTPAWTDADGEQRMGIRIGSACNNVTFRNNIIHSIAQTSGSLNQSAIMISADASGKYWSFQNNEFYGLNKAYGILGYSADKVLIEDNYFHDNSDGHQIGPKAGTQYWTIRHNKMTNINGGTGIWIYGANETRGENGYMDISYNYVQMKYAYDDALSVNQSFYEKMGPVDAYRNTLVGNVIYFGMKTGVSTSKNHRNVILNSNSNFYTCQQCDNPSLVVFRDNLTGTPGSGIIDANGKLTSNYSSYLGTAGWQFSNQ